MDESNGKNEPGGQEPGLIVVTPHGRSGSFFFQSLFDDHHQVITFPTSGFVYPKPKQFNDITLETDKFIQENPDIFDSSKGYLGVVEQNVSALFGENSDQHLSVDKMQFRHFAIEVEFANKIGSHSPISRRDFIIGLHRSFYHCLGYDVSKIKYILIHLHGYDGSHRRALEDFPDLYYFAMTRDPREDWLSWDKVCKLRFEEDYDKFRTLYRYICVKRFARDLKGLVSIYPLLAKKRLKIIDLNKFHAKNKKAMTSIANLLDIEFVELLLQSTFLGQTWHGNAADRTSITGFDPKRSQVYWPKRLSKLDERLISTYLKESIHILHYPSGTYDNSSRIKPSMRLVFDFCNKETSKKISEFLKKKTYNHPMLQKIPRPICKLFGILFFLQQGIRLFFKRAIHEYSWLTDVKSGDKIFKDYNFIDDK